MKKHGPVRGYQCFGGTSELHFQFYPEDESNKSFFPLQNNDSTEHHHPEAHNCNFHGYAYLKSFNVFFLSVTLLGVPVNTGYDILFQLLTLTQIFFLFIFHFLLIILY